MRALDSDADARRLARIALVAPNLKVLYVPTAKAACTSVTLMIAQAEGSYRPELADRVVSNQMSPQQVIHSASVNGLPRLAQLPPREVHHILNSSDWLRFTSIRNPLRRVYSAWENRLLLRAPGFARSLADSMPDVLSEGRLDFTATFANFVTAFSERTEDFFRDHHFTPQTRFTRPDLINYNMIVRVDDPRAISGIASMLAERSRIKKNLLPQRLNEGLGIPLDLVCNLEHADLLMRAYQTDYDTFGFSHEEARSTLRRDVSPYLLGTTETRLLQQIRGALQRSLDIADAHRFRRALRFRAMRAVHVVLHKASRRHIAMPQRYM